jgi:alpha-galactosidase
MIGAGSVVFVKNLLTDILSAPELANATIALHDIDMERLETGGAMARWTAERLGVKPKIEEHQERRECVRGADFIINMVLIGGLKPIAADFEIPAKYGLRQTVADTVGIGGIFRGLRTIPFMIQLCRDIAELCPDALLLNYTNPMSILTWAVYKAFPDLQIVGLCHNIQNTAEDLARYLKVSLDRLSYDCAGINHMTWFLRLQIDGKDAYPALRAAMEDPRIYDQDRVRFELFRQFGWFVSESSRHNAEYAPYFIKNDAEVKKYLVPVDDLKHKVVRRLGEFRETRRKLLANEDFEIKKSNEFGASIMCAKVTNKPTLIYGNVRNTGLIENLPADCCVEVPVVIDRNGLRPCHAGTLPLELAAHCAPHVFVQGLTVNAALTGDRDLLYRAALLDRNASAMLSIDQIRKMIDELVAYHGDSMPEGLRPTNRRAACGTAIQQPHAPHHV